MLRDSTSGEGGIRTREPFGYPLSKRAHSATMRPLPTRLRSLRSLRLAGSLTSKHFVPSRPAGDEGPDCTYGFTRRGKAATRSPGLSDRLGHRRRGRDSNPRGFRLSLFESDTINHSDTSPLASLNFRPPVKR